MITVTLAVTDLTGEKGTPRLNGGSPSSPDLDASLQASSRKAQRRLRFCSLHRPGPTTT